MKIKKGKKVNKKFFSGSRQKVSIISIFNFFFQFCVCIKWLQNIIKKTPKKYYKEKHVKTIKIFLKKKKMKKHEYAHNRYRKLLWKMNLVKKKKEEKYNNLSEEKKAKDTNMHMKNIEIFLKNKKAKNVNIIGNTMKIFPKIIKKDRIILKKLLCNTKT